MMVLMCQKPNGHKMDRDSDLVTIKTLQPHGDLQIIHGYGDGGFRISGSRFAGSVLVTPRETVLWTPPEADKLSADTITTLLPDNLPPLFRLGVGAGPRDPLHALAKGLKQQGVALELMSTAAACRTWNVLISEGRNAAAALYAVD